MAMCGMGIRCECALQALGVVINRTSRHRSVSFHYPAGNRPGIIVMTEWAVVTMITFYWLVAPSRILPLKSFDDSNHWNQSCWW